MFTGKEITEIVPGAKLANCAVGDLVMTSIVTDSRQDCSGALFVALKGDNFDGHDYLDKAVASGAAALCVSANFAKTLSIPEQLPVVIVDDTLKTYQLLAKSHRERMACRIIGVTGSSGKTSTKEIIRTILVRKFGRDAVLATEGNTNNHVGVPQNLLKLNEKHRYAVIEMGTNHPGEIAVLADMALPDVSVISSIGNAHIEFFGNTDGVAREKSAIFAGYPDTEGIIHSPIAIFPASGEGNRVLREQAGSEFYTFGQAGSDADLKYEYLGGNLKGGRFRLINGKRLGSTAFPNWSESIQWSLQGAHQVSNATAAALAALAVAVPESDIEGAFQECTLPGMRMRITEKDGITWINDAYNANPDSVKATLNWLAEFADSANLKVILGDMLEIGESAPKFHRQVLEHAIDRLPASQIFGVGKVMSSVGLHDAGLKRRANCFPDSTVAAEELKVLIRTGDMVFLKGSRGTRLEKICE